ncbi:hypothetical protein DWB77_00313 [Streptomyces hundungensis]|uniref:Uncharacterized protein n=1 Tax=Streptomyces hundungensis TaxID=1077946 RepID=A0A387H3F3_9ACTN|nr:hypothetical protein [Streptomyces hundungensis]AYG78206.1 hypothetical protein DWB77_00313 [Streptomyces hundungensis]
MSWDVLLLHLPDDVASVQDIPDGFSPHPLGSQRDVLAAVARAAPEADLSDPAWGELCGATWSIELNIGADSPVDTVMLHIRGSGDDVLTSVTRLGRALGCKALDCSTGKVLADQEPTGWHAFQNYRDRVTGVLPD